MEENLNTGRCTSVYVGPHNLCSMNRFNLFPEFKNGGFWSHASLIYISQIDNIKFNASHRGTQIHLMGVNNH